MIDKEKLIDDLSSTFNYFEDCETDREFYYEIQNLLFRIKSGDFDIEKQKENCKWKLESEYYDFPIVYESDCNNIHYFEEGNTRFNRFRWCPYCGKEIEEIEE